MMYINITGDKKRRDTIQAVIYSPEFDYYITASQKGAISIYNGKVKSVNYCSLSVFSKCGFALI